MCSFQHFPYNTCFLGIPEHKSFSFLELIVFGKTQPEQVACRPTWATFENGVCLFPRFTSHIHTWLGGMLLSHDDSSKKVRSFHSQSGTVTFTAGHHSTPMNEIMKVPGYVWAHGHCSLPHSDLVSSYFMVTPTEGN